MPSRSEMDTPAMVTVVILGILLIAASFPFLESPGAGGMDYAIQWSQAEAGSAQADSGAAGTTTTIRVPVTDIIPSNATIALESCTDGAQPPATQPATITWTLFEGEEQKAAGTLQCGDPDEKVELERHPDVGQVTAASASAAVREAYSAGNNETVEYRLVFSWTRPSGPAPLPLPLPVGGAFSATLALTIEDWVATANEAGQEVPR